MTGTHSSITYSRRIWLPPPARLIYPVSSALKFSVTVRTVPRKGMTSVKPG
ncbi:hypothetical protein EMPG_15403 [Blastomyces silverae]|uniref:Uncharacterized protein n=1 Tax=Blastomyces silverae TaxID=2060906 RepID=A0A0H1BDG4_9EURO|nr:hypothetical protein EMPG_15403 [Blastomyces silverae]